MIKIIINDCNQKISARCILCLKIFELDESVIKLEDHVFYHNECFGCYGPCNKPILTDFYKIDDDRYVCDTCYDQYGMDFDKIPKEDYH